MSESQETKKTVRMTLNSLADLQNLISSVLHDNNSEKIEQTIDKIEKKTNISREKFVYVIGALVCAYMVFGALAEIVCNAIGFAYPAYASVKALFLLYLYLPQTSGALTVYENVIDPAITKIDQFIEKYYSQKQK
ncbi:Receptor expression-enhancing protein 5 [Toxocara canis]|uniref:Receptor expression-enhancing protein 5 n=1 Tax=Toxocara canis TaxID=6265 RepID=A0A0B2UT20_TOXCA|nr:Receptor expression-enhancing protein 5 [Toxocara canis]